MILPGHRTSKCITAPTCYFLLPLNYFDSLSEFAVYTTADGGKKEGRRGQRWAA